MASAAGVMWETGALDATSGGAETKSEMGVSRGTASAGAASVFFENSHMLRLARGVCVRGGHGERPTRWRCDQRYLNKLSKSTTSLPLTA